MTLQPFRGAVSSGARVLLPAMLALSWCAGRADPLPVAPTVTAGGPRAPVLPRVTLPSAPEPDGATAGSGTGTNPFTGRAAPAATTTGQTLTAPVTVNANTTADALTVTQTGGGRAINGTVTSSSNGLSAVKGITAGTGSGVNGVHGGTGGQAGKFEITNASSTQPSLLVTTVGSGSGVQAIVKSTAMVDAPAVLGQHNAATGWGIGVQGDGGYYGVIGNGGHFGVVGNSTSGNGVTGYSASGGDGVYGSTTSLSAGSYGVEGYSTHYAGMYGWSEVAIGVYGVSNSGNGVVGKSLTGYAGLFQGPVMATGAMTAASYGYTSDRDQKQDFSTVDSADVLARVAAMPITAWDYKAKPAERHIGPMAQDFRAAFGLGVDDKHIDVVDGIGVSLAAIKALQRQLQDKDARIDALAAQVEQRGARIDTLDARLAALEQTAAAMALTSAARP